MPKGDIEYKKLFKAIKKGEEYDKSSISMFTVKLLEKLIEE